MEDSFTEIKLSEGLARAHEGNARLPIVEKLKILDELQETALVFGEIRKQRGSVINPEG